MNFGGKLLTANCQLEPQSFCKNQQCPFQGRHLFQFLQNSDRFVIGVDNDGIAASFHDGAIAFALNREYFHAAGFLGWGFLFEVSVLRAFAIAKALTRSPTTMPKPRAIPSSKRRIDAGREIRSSCFLVVLI